MKFAKTTSSDDMSISKETSALLNKTPKPGVTSTSEYTQLLKGSQEKPAYQSADGRLLVTLCILATEMCERLTYYSIIAGLVLYSTSNLGLNQVDASTLNQVFSGFVYLVPILGGFLADSFSGRYNIIFYFTLIYILGTILLPSSAVNYEDWGWRALSTGERKAMFYTGLVLVALGTGGIKANVGPLGAEQVESRGKEAVQSFFNWFYWVINIGALIAYTVVAYIQQEVSFAWGYFIPMCSMMVALLVFVIASSRYTRTTPKGSILTVAFGICKQGACKTRPPPNPSLPGGSERKLLARSKKSFGGYYSDHLVDGVTSVIRVIPFCLLVVMYWAIYAQMTNTFFAQAERMDVRLGGGLNVPAAALNAFNTIGIIVLIPIVDRVVYPFFERLGHPLTYLKRIGIGLVLAAAGVAVAGVVEIYRKRELNREGGSHIQVLAGQNFTASSMSVFMQVPQFTLIGASEIFTSVTCLEFAYNQAPVAMQGLLTGLFFSASGIGNWVSSAILSIVETATADDPWWGPEINNAKMENLMFLLTGLTLLNTIIFCIVAHFYTYQDPKSFQDKLEVPGADGKAYDGRGVSGPGDVPGPHTDGLSDTSMLYTRVEPDNTRAGWDDESGLHMTNDGPGFVDESNDKTPLANSAF